MQIGMGSNPIKKYFFQDNTLLPAHLFLHNNALFISVFFSILLFFSVVYFFFPYSLDSKKGFLRQLHSAFELRL